MTTRRERKMEFKRRLLYSVSVIAGEARNWEVAGEDADELGLTEEEFIGVIDDVANEIERRAERITPMATT